MTPEPPRFRSASARLPPMRSGDRVRRQVPIAQPGHAQGGGAVLLTRRSGRTLARYHLATGRVEQVSGVTGELRAAVFDPDGQRAWLLAVFGLCRVALQPLAITQVVRTGLGTWKDGLCALGPGWLGVFNSMQTTLAVVDRATGQLRTTLRFPGPDLVRPGPTADTAWLVALRDGRAGLLDLGSLRVTQRRRLPKATTPVVAGDEVLALGDQVTVDGVPADRFGRPSRERVVALGVDDFGLRRHGPPLPDLTEMLGVDGAGRPLVATRQGFIVLDRATLTPLARFELGRLVEAACHVPGEGTGEDTVVLVPFQYGSQRMPEEVVVVGWHR